MKEESGWAYDWNHIGSKRGVLVQRGTGCVYRDAKLQRVSKQMNRPLTWTVEDDTVYQHLYKHEGWVSYMYLDTEGKVTVGMGHQIAEEADVVALRFHRRIPMGDIKPLVYADADEKRRAWRAVRERQDLKKSHYSKFKELTRLDLSDGEIWTLAMNDIDIVRKELQDTKRFPKMATYPRSAQLGLYDMGYNLGVPNLVEIFRKFTPAVQWRDWKVAAAESHRLQPSEQRNRAVREMFEKALKQEPFFVHPACKKSLTTLHSRGR